MFRPRFEYKKLSWAIQFESCKSYSPQTKKELPIKTFRLWWNYWRWRNSNAEPAMFTCTFLQHSVGSGNILVLKVGPWPFWNVPQQKLFYRTMKSSATWREKWENYAITTNENYRMPLKHFDGWWKAEGIEGIVKVRVEVGDCRSS